MNNNETELSRTHESLQSALARLILVWLTSVFALLTVLTHLAQIVGIPFNVYVIIGVAAALIMTFVVLRLEVPKVASGVVKADHRTTFALLACCLFSVALCQLSYRPYLDDSFYLPSVVYYLENPDEAMGFAVPFIDSGGEPFVSYHRGSTPFEYTQAIAARVTHLRVLTIYYVLAPALLGFMIPLVWFYLLSRFVRSSSAVVFGTLLICVCLLLMGSRHQSFGNYAFNRIFQGKAVVFAIGIPFFIAITVDFFRSPRLRDWLYLLALSTAMVGCTVAAAVLVPLLAIVLAVACGISYLHGVRSRIRVGAAYLGSLAYPAAYAGTILLFSSGDVGRGSSLHGGWPLTFLEQARFVWSDPAAIVFMIAGTTAGIVFLRNENRRFLIIWCAAMFVLYLNPVIAPLLIKYVTSPIIYWRLFYLLPFPLVIGLSGAALVSYLENRRPAWRLLVPGVLILLLLLAHVPGPSWSVFHSTSLRRPGYKVTELSLTRQVLDISPPRGSMIAPATISMAAAVLTAKYKHVCYRHDGIRMWFEIDGRSEEADRRMLASRCLNGKVNEQGLGAVRWLLERYPQITTLVARDTAIEEHDRYLESHLRRLGFTPRGRAEDMLVFSRSGSRR